MKVQLFLSAVTALSAGGSALAQTPPTPAPPRIQSPTVLVSPWANTARFEQFQRELAVQRITRQALLKARAVDVDRAVRVAALIDGGECGPAEQLARSEGDQRMADRAVQICRSRGF